MAPNPTQAKLAMNRGLLTGSQPAGTIATPGVTPSGFAPIVPTPKTQATPKAVAKPKAVNKNALPSLPGMNEPVFSPKVVASLPPVKPKPRKTYHAPWEDQDAAAKIQQRWEDNQAREANVANQKAAAEVERKYGRPKPAPVVPSLPTGEAEDVNSKYEELKRSDFSPAASFKSRVKSLISSKAELGSQGEQDVADIQGYHRQAGVGIDQARDTQMRNQEAVQRMFAGMAKAFGGTAGGTSVHRAADANSLAAGRQVSESGINHDAFMARIRAANDTEGAYQADNARNRTASQLAELNDQVAEAESALSEAENSGARDYKIAKNAETDSKLVRQAAAEKKVEDRRNLVLERLRQILPEALSEGSNLEVAGANAKRGLTPEEQAWISYQVHNGPYESQYSAAVKERAAKAALDAAKD